MSKASAKKLIKRVHHVTRPHGGKFNRTHYSKSHPVGTEFRKYWGRALKKKRQSGNSFWNHPLPP